MPKATTRRVTFRLLRFPARKARRMPCARFMAKCSTLAYGNPGGTAVVEKLIDMILADTDAKHP
jgi:hypothetical protein